MMGKEITKKTDQDLIAQYERELIKEQSSQLENPQFMAVKIKHAGVHRFEMPAIGEEEPKLLKTFSGVIIFNHRLNSYWEAAFGETDNRIPDCFALDAIHGTKFGNCKECKFNKFGSGRDGRGKACRNMWRLYIFLNKKMLLPYQLTLPPTSLKNFQNYIISLLSQNIAIERVITKFSLTEGAQESSVVNFAIGSKLSNDDFLFYLNKRKKLLEFMKAAIFFEENSETQESEEETEPEEPFYIEAMEDESEQEEIPF